LWLDGEGRSSRFGCLVHFVIIECMHIHITTLCTYTQLIDVLSTYVDVGGKMKELDSI
jgi:hypothetical protein